MKYMGSKRKLAKDLLPIILKNRKPNQWYVEPFVGGCNMIEHVTGNRIGSDIHRYLIALFKALQKGWTPPTTVSEYTYNQVRQNKDSYPDELVGYIGFGAFGAKWFAGYPRTKTDDTDNRDNYKEHYRGIMKQIPKILGIDFCCCDYRGLEIPKNSIIYCDIPYCGTTKYSNDFDHESFYTWTKNKKEEGHKVFFTEYYAPEDFKCLGEKCVVINFDSTRVEGEVLYKTEKLFTVK